MRILLLAYESGGHVLFRFFLFPVVLFYFLSHPLARRASRQYRQRMHAANPEFPEPRAWHGFLHMWHFANTLLDKLSVWRGKITLENVVVDNDDIIDQLLAEKRGAILLISHLGNFEVCQALSERHASLNLTVIQHTAHAEKFNRFLDKHSRETRVEFMQVRDMNVGEAIMLSDKLGQGTFVAISADRVPVANPERAEMIPFLGRPALFPSGPFVLAVTLQAPVLSVQSIKLEGRYHIHFEILSEGGPIPRQGRRRFRESLMADYVKDLEKHCLMAPWQWYNFYPFWRESE